MPHRKPHIDSFTLDLLGLAALMLIVPVLGFLAGSPA